MSQFQVGFQWGVVDALEVLERLGIRELPEEEAIRRADERSGTAAQRWPGMTKNHGVGYFLGFVSTLCPPLRWRGVRELLAQPQLMG